MKMHLLFFLFFCIVKLYSQLYVSPFGSDKNNGTKLKPVYSLQAAFDLAKNHTDNDLVINVESGDYFMSQSLYLDEKNSRNASNKLKVLGDKKKAPTFFGGKRVVPLVNPVTKYWEIDMSSQYDSDTVLSFFSVNGNQRLASKYPKSQFVKSEKIEYIEDNVVVTIPSDLNEILRKYSQEDIKKVVVTFYVKWTNLIRYIDSHDYKKKTITFQKLSLPDMYKIVANETLFKVSNLKQSLQKGEWYFDDKKIIYNPMSAEDSKLALIIIPTINEFIKAKGNHHQKVSYIEFENLNFNTIGTGLPKTGYFPHQAAVNVPASFDFKYCSNINFKNIIVENTSNYAFWFQEGCEDLKILSSKFSNLGAGAVKIGNTAYSSDLYAVKNVILDNNRISNGGILYPDATALNIINSFSNTISNNDISDFTYTGISIGWVWGYGKSLSKNNTITYNHIYNIGKGALDDMAGIYTLGVSNGTIIRNNVIHDVKSNNYGGWGIYTDEGSSGILIENNLVYNCKSSGFHQHYGKDNTIRNNIFAYNGDAELESSKIENHNSFNFVNNIVVHKDDNFFAGNWLRVKSNNKKNIYYSERGNIDQKQLKKEYSLNSDPGLQKIDFYYKITNREVINKIEFKIIDYSLAGIRKNDN